MKRFIPIIFWVMSGNLFAQQSGIYNLGYLGGQSTVSGTDGEISVNISGGNVIPTDQFHTLLQDKVQVTVGFPAMVSYFPRVFDSEYFISKGYFSDYVQLQWNIVGQQDRIDRIKVFRKILGSTSDSLLVATIAADNFTYRDEYAEKGVLYEYTVFADGIANELRIPGINFMQGVGFAFPFGTASGRVTYEGGTAVEGVQILAETDGNLGGKSLDFNGTDAYLNVPHLPDHTELELKDGFTLQMWAKYAGSSKGTLFSKGDQYELAYESGSLTFTVNDVVLDMPYTHPTDEYFHVTASYDVTNGLSLFVLENDLEGDSAFASAPTQPSESVDELVFARSNAQDNYFLGKIDEIRIWNIALTGAEATGNYSRYLNGTEEGLAGYWRLNSGIGNGFYDFSRIGFEFNENHGEILRAEWSLDIPTQSQLAYRGVTDQNGNYVVRGFPYETSGSQYTFTPIFGVHSFEPTQQLRYVGDGSSIFNGLDFEDVSSFPVSGTVRYRNSYFPVEGVSILIDGNPATNSEGELIVSDVSGQFTVDVPIGEHSLRLSKSGHEFEGEGRFPPPASQGDIPTFNYQSPLSGIEFIDNSVVKLAGRVVGGPVESEKALGFGLSQNNIGIAEIHVTSEKGFDISASTFDPANPDSTQVYDEPEMVTRTEFNADALVIYPDEETGEFVTFLPPEKYIITAVTAGSYVFGNEHHVSVNLEQSFEQSESHEEIIKAEVDGDELPGYPAYNDEDYDYFSSSTNGDTTFTIGGNNFEFESRKDFILRENPDIEVVNSDGVELFGESVYAYADELTEENVLLIDGSDNYTFGYPVFFQQSRYQMNISVFEEYTNDDAGTTDRVPVKDGTVEIVNDFATNPDMEVLSLDENGKARYSFSGGHPSFTVNGAESFTKPFSLTAVTGETGNIRTIWRESDPLRGIVFGGRPEGNNFVTTGPNQIMTILRDPPGSNSFAFLEQGNSITNTVSWGSEITNSLEAKAKISLGPDIEISRGVGVETTFEIDATADLELGLEMTQAYTSSNESENTVTSTKTWSTSENSKFVSSPGDVFVGHSTNIVYGAATTVQPVPTSSSECADPGDCGTTEYNGYALGQRSKLRLNPEFGTMFIYTQSHIENVLIPDLKEIRNGLLSYSETPGSVVATDEPIYLSLVPPSDERFGSANYSIEDWGNDANVDVGAGPSYEIILPSGYDLNLVSDTIAYFNKQIEGWTQTLANNEKVKVEAQLSENISFDGGTTFASSETVESTSTYSFDFNVGINASMATAVGLTVNGVGAEVNLSQSIQMGRSQGGGSQVANATSYGYTFADEENAGQTADFYSIDVKTPSDGFGPVFVTRAGVTSCPYEGDEKTQYFEPGQHTLNFATIQVEKPDITIVNPLVANVPSNREAEIILELKNESENNSGTFYNLSVDDQSNPNGATLSIDGSPLTGDGRGFFIPGGQVVTKVLKVSKGSDDTNDYENILLKLSSECDNNISDSQSFSVYFQPACSDINLVSPVDLWTVNTNTVPSSTQNVVFDEYDLQNSQFRFAKFQYKASSSSQWLTNMIFYNPQLVSQSEFDALDEPKAWLDQDGSTLYNWDMNDLPDRNYDIQVASVCEIAPGDLIETPSETHMGIKDTKRPIAFGAPQPADGVLSANDEILIQFDETIESGLLTPFNFSVKGVLNSTDISHGASIKLDGVNDYIRIPDGLNLSNSSFTIEFWLKRENFSAEEVIYSKGYSTEDAFRFGFTSTNEFFLDIGNQRLTSTGTYSDTEWAHYAVVYSSDNNSVDVFRNDEFVIDNQNVTGSFTGEGQIAIGKSGLTDDRYFTGNIHDFRIWDKYRQLGDIFSKMNLTLMGSEVGLIGYWPMDEANGSTALDLARFRHANVMAGWEVSPAGKSYAFDGIDDYLELNTGSTVIVTDEMDYTIEFWFNGSPGQTNSVLFSSGKGDGSDLYNDPENSLSIGFDEEGQLYLLNDGHKISAQGDYLDDNWHHFAFTLLRQSNATLMVDGEQKISSVSDNFGGLSGATMWIGARGFIPSPGVKEFDQYFDGFIEEFRVWNTARRLEQIRLNRGSRLIGDEIGLIAYYPFEFYQTINGIKILNTSIQDHWINPFGNNAGTATSNGGADYSDNTPNIKDARPFQSIDFDWTVNDDAIIITPSSTFTTLIEQTVLEITVQNIEDLNENRMPSPITWTAFVDRNQLKWGAESIEVVKDVYEPYSFTVDVVNHGGTETNYSIENLPRWLSTSAQSGVLAPSSLKAITFTINEGLNTGYYTEDIFLSSDFGFDEKLSIDLSVFSPAPDWKVNPGDFEFSMNLVALVEIEGVLSSDLNDRVAAFVGDEIRGDADIHYLDALDAYLVFLDIFSNVESGENVELRVWDASKGVEYRNALPAISFVSNTIMGSPSTPETIIAGINLTQHVVLEKGWNWTSFNLQSTQLSDVNSLMSNVSSETGDQIKGRDNFDIYTEGIGWSGTISSSGGLEVGEMYLINSSGDEDLTLVGPNPETNLNISIAAGWNWLGYVPRFNMSVDEAFAFFTPESGDLIKGQFSFAVYDEILGWLGTLKTLQPGRGYLFSSTNSGSFKYPEISSLNGRISNESNLVKSHEELNRRNFPRTMSMIATIPGFSESNYLLAAFHGNEIRGLIPPVELPGGGHQYFLTIHGEEIGKSLTFKLINTEEYEEVINLDQTAIFSPDQPLGSIYGPFEFTGAFDITGVSSSGNHIQVYPNPFVDHLDVIIPGDSNSEPQIRISDLSGKTQNISKPILTAKGWHLQLNGEDFRRGVYLLQVIGNPSRTVRIIKK